MYEINRRERDKLYKNKEYEKYSFLNEWEQLIKDLNSIKNIYTLRKGHSRCDITRHISTNSFNMDRYLSIYTYLREINYYGDYACHLSIKTKEYHREPHFRFNGNFWFNDKNVAHRLHNICNILIDSDKSYKNTKEMFGA